MIHKCLIQILRCLLGTRNESFSENFRTSHDFIATRLQRDCDDFHWLWIMAARTVRIGLNKKRKPVILYRCSVFQFWNGFLAPRSDDPWTIQFPRKFRAGPFLARLNFVCSTNVYVTQVCISAHGDEWLVLFELQITECGRHKIILIWN